MGNNEIDYRAIEEQCVTASEAYPHDSVPAKLARHARALLTRIRELQDQIDAQNVCEVCSVVMIPGPPPRCEEHVNTQPGDDEWPEDEDDEERDECAFCGELRPPYVPPPSADELQYACDKCKKGAG